MGVPAVAGKDYEHAEGVVNFEVGETKKTIKVKLIDDMVYEPDETFEVALATPRKMKAGAGNLGKADFNWRIPHRCTVTIVDDDFPGRLRFGSASVYPDEQGNTATLHVQREDVMCYESASFNKKHNDFIQVSESGCLCLSLSVTVCLCLSLH